MNVDTFLRKISGDAEEIAFLLVPPTTPDELAEAREKLGELRRDVAQAQAEHEAAFRQPVPTRNFASYEDAVSWAKAQVGHMAPEAMHDELRACRFLNLTAEEAERIINIANEERLLAL